MREYETGAAQGDGSRASRAAARARARLPSPRPFPSSPCARSSPRTGLRSCSRLCPLPSLTARARTTRRSPRVASRRCSTRPTSAASSAATRGTARSSRSARTTRRARPRHTDGVEGAHRASFAAACAASRATTRYASTWGIDSASTNLTSRAYTSGVELRCVGRGGCGGGVLGLAALFISYYIPSLLPVRGEHRPGPRTSRSRMEPLSCQWPRTRRLPVRAPRRRARADGLGHGRRRHTDRARVGRAPARPPGCEGLLPRDSG